MASKRRKTRHHGSTRSFQYKKARLAAKEAAIAPVQEICSLTREEKCEAIAELSQAVVENPNGAFRKMEEESEDVVSVSRMQRLLQLAHTVKNGGDNYVARLAVLSLLAIYVDILPSYRIRLPTAEEMAVRVTKEKKALWDYERALLNHYQMYLKLLQSTWDKEQASGPDGPTMMAITSILCFCKLLESVPHFNFRSNILSLVVRQMNHSVEEVRSACCGAVRKLFEADAQAEISLEATRSICKMVINYNNFQRLHPCVLQTFLSLPLRVHDDEANAAKLAAAAQAKKRRKNKQEAEIEDELKESSATVDKIVLAKSQADTLEAVMLLYFKILKQNPMPTKLLPPALEGLAKFAHLINIDVVINVLDLLKHLLQTVDVLPLDAALNSIWTAFRTLQGPGREMKIDPKEYVTPLYGQLPRLCTQDMGEQIGGKKLVDVAISCLRAALITRREYSTNRIAAFAKRLGTVSLHCPSHVATTLLAFLQVLQQRYPSVLQQLLDNESDVVTAGLYDGFIDDPDHANPYATSAWELSLQKFRYHPRVSLHSQDAARYKPLQQLTLTPERIAQQMREDKDNLCIQSHRITKKHPLAPKESGTNSKRQRRMQQEVRFITPPETKSRSFHPYPYLV